MASVPPFNMGKLPTVFREAFHTPYHLIKDEPNFWHADYEFAYNHGGILTKALLRYLWGVCKPIEPVRIDTRAHFLQPGQSPGLAFWHTDFATDRPDVNLCTRHFIYFSGGPPTEYIVNREISGTESKDTWMPRGGDVVVIDATEIHRSTPWVGKEPIWRWFFRATIMPAGRAYLKGTILNQVKSLSELPVDKYT